MQRIIRFIGPVLLAVVLAACEPVPPPEPENLTMAVAKHPTNALIFVALEHKLFEKHGVNVAIQLYPSGKRAIEEALLPGLAAMANSFDTPVALTAFSHPELRVLASTVRVDNINQIVARRDKGIERPADLKGRRIGVQSASALHFFLHQFLLDAGIGDKEVNLEFFKVEELPDVLAEGRVDAVSLREPMLSQCREKLGERATVFAAPGLYDEMELLVTTDAWLQAHPAAARGVLAALLEAEAHVLAHPQEAQSITARYLGIKETEVVRDWPNYLLRVELRQSLFILLEEQVRWALDIGLLQGKMPDYYDNLAPEALMELAPERVTLIR